MTDILLVGAFAALTILAWFVVDLGVKVRKLTLAHNNLVMAMALAALEETQE